LPVVNRIAAACRSGHGHRLTDLEVIMLENQASAIGRRRRGAPSAPWQTLAGWFFTCWQRHRQRRELLDLDDRMLRDIGVSRDDARLEAQKRFWE
jgi:uncharacterized protein YjiS (DUF1127 family)